MKLKLSAEYKIAISAVILVFTVMIIGLSHYSQQNENITKPLFANDTITIEPLKEDFEFILKRLERVHPLTLKGFSKEQEKIITHIREEIAAPMTKSQFFFLINQLFHTFHDAHTTLWPSWNRGIPLALLWLEEGLFNEYASEYFHVGDRVIAIGNRSVEQLHKDMQAMVCAENDISIRLVGQGFLITETYLEEYGLVDQDSVHLTIERDHQQLEIVLPMIRLGPRPGGDTHWIGTRIDTLNDMAVLQLDQCIYNSAYLDSLTAFFGKVAANKINHVVLDLRKNNGGNANVINTFLSFLDIDSYTSYGASIRYSDYARKFKKETKYGFHKGAPVLTMNIRVLESQLLFKGELIVLTGPRTFSSANMFAVTIQDNGLGLIIGESTSNSPTCFGDPINFTTPNTGIDFRISYKHILRPDSTLNQLSVLTPNIMVPTKIGDIVSGNDPQMERVLQYISLNK